MVVVSVLASCHPQEAYDLGQDPYSVQGTRLHVSEHCALHAPGDRQSADPPSTHEVALGSAQVLQQCGLIYNEVYVPAFQARFAREICGSADGTADDACAKRFVDMFFARLSDRYPLTDWNEVNRKCTAYPLDCRDGLGIERIVLASHNAGVRAKLERARADARQAEEEEEARASERRRQAVRTFLQSLNPPTVRCTSNTYGNTTQTTCN